ncbi:MAG TPA: hypothetical protein VFD92_03555 [Candidatus Binatia bacterium]|nr:hypothetical protein [Candidatus Binatia bacterium]
MTHEHIASFDAWRNRADANPAVVRPVVPGFVSSVLVAAITRQAGKPGPSGFEPRRAT